MISSRLLSTHEANQRTGDAQTATRMWDDLVAMHMPSGADHWMLAAKVLGCIMDAARWTVRCSRSTFTSVRTMVTTWSVKLSRNPTVMIFKMICQTGKAGR